jgi:alkanesulfonate monooxygenase SsuD/methylene tetrahydromethanopterin reductase-like flavin-dependent oxidoreductase (luciferase family)
MREDSMKRGVSIFNTDYSIRIDDLARALETRGFESLWLPEHTHIPKSRRSPWPGELNPPGCSDNTLEVPAAIATVHPSASHAMKHGGSHERLDGNS